MVEKLDKALVENPPLSTKEGGMIKNGYDSTLDDLKLASSDGKQYIANLENYEKEYLSSISAKLDKYSLQYKELYTQCYEEISGYSSSSLQSSVLKGLSKAAIAVGKVVEKMPVVGDTQADETLVSAGDKLNDISAERVRRQMQKLIERQSNFVRPFIDNINMINDLYNKPLQMLVDKDNLYIASVGVPRDNTVKNG